MTAKVTIPNTFATATTAIPLSQLDGNFSNVNAAINNALTFSNYAVDTGTANNYAITITGQTTTYAAGIAFQFKAANTNTGASTLNVNGQGTQSIVKTDGSALVAGDIVSGAIATVMYDGTNFQLLNDSGGAGGTFTNITVTGTATIATGNVANLISANVAITGGSITGITDLAVADGGTGSSSLTAENVLIGNGTAAVKFVAPGTTGNVLTSNGTTWISQATSSTTPSLIANGTSNVAIATANGNITMVTAGTEKLRISTTGTVNVSNNAIGVVNLANTGSFDMSLGNYFNCTPTGNITMTFTNVTAGQGGYVVLNNGNNYAVTANSTVVKLATGTTTTLSANGTYLLSYFAPNATVVLVGSTGALS